MNLQSIIILFLFFVGLFIKPFSYGLWDFIYKFVVFVSIIYLFYKNFFQTNEESIEINLEEKARKTIPKEIDLNNLNSWQLSDLIYEDESTIKYITDQFLALSSILIPDQGWIVYKSNEYKLNVIDQISFTDLKLETIPEQIDLSGLFKIVDDRDEILIENNIQDAKDSFQYYQNIDYEVSSFLSIPIKLSESEKIFFLFDSETAEQFNKEDFDIIEKIVNGIQLTLNSRLKSASLFSELKSNKKLLEFAVSLNKCNTISAAIESLTEFVSNEYEADRLTISSKIQDSEKAKIRKVVGQQDSFQEETEFMLEEGLTGWVIGKNKPYIIDDLEKGEYFIPRYSKDEKSNYGLRSFLGIPFNYDNDVYGAITLENKNPNKYNDFDKKLLQDISYIFTTTYIRKNSNKKEI